MFPPSSRVSRKKSPNQTEKMVFFCKNPLNLAVHGIVLPFFTHRIPAPTKNRKCAAVFFYSHAFPSILYFVLFIPFLPYLCKILRVFLLGDFSNLVLFRHNHPPSPCVDKSMRKKLQEYAQEAAFPLVDDLRKRAPKFTFQFLGNALVFAAKFHL